ncbi:MAG TPA: diacylglycerol kinase family lipid kinase [Gemmatimonadaceae bacterium]|nr:diacylglycerol kinase family lipid kinase [Gemmatimonadaceae bacterium]
MIRLLWNPASGRGRGAQLIPRIRAAFAARGITDLVQTERPGDEARLVQEAIADGVQTIVVAGGDGTWGKSAVALARAGSPARMAFVAAGTGNDFAKNLRAPATDFEAMAALVASGGVERRVDLGRVDDNWFANVAGFGFDVEVLMATQGARLLRGPAVYVTAALGQLFAFGGVAVSITGVASLFAARRQRLMLVFANGKEFGGAFKIAPMARVDDGKLDAVVFEDGIKLGRVALLARALRGTHLAHPKVFHKAGAEFRLEFDAPPSYELDGDLHLAPSRRVTVASLPGVLRVLDAAG